jgi:ribosomal protein S12 methylthiotransferase accessory factor
MQPLAYPMAFGHWHVLKNKLVCRLPRKTVTVSAPADLLCAVAELCTGNMGWREIAAELGGRWSATSVDAFLSQLSQEGVLIEAGESLAGWTEMGQLPALYPRVSPPEEVPLLHLVAQRRLLQGTGMSAVDNGSPANTLARLLQQRQSYRTFADASLASGELASILWAAHGVARPAADSHLKWHRTVGSGGNMHSGRWFVFVLRELRGSSSADLLLPGLYEARFHVDGGASFQLLEASASDAWRVLLEPRALTFASALVMPVHDVSVPARKYGNRATVFAHVEAGQSLQNAQLMATSLGAASIVRGDTSSADVMDVLRPHLQHAARAKAQWLVMPSLLVGAKPSTEQIALQRTDDWIKVGIASTLHNDRGPSRSKTDRSFAFCAGPVQEGDSEIYTTGRNADPRLASVKAQAEAWERRGWANLGEAIVEGAIKDIPGAMHPHEVVGYSAEQYRTDGFPLRPFAPRRKYLWAKGVDVATGQTRLLPAECVYAFSALPRVFRARGYTNSSTSGVAAWTDAEGALCRGTLELIERDAFLRHWLMRQPPPRVSHKSLPASLRQRVNELQSAGHRVAISQVGDRFVPVYSVFVQATDRPFTAVTAAADFDHESALGKALDEAEGRAAHATAFPAAPLSVPQDVQSTSEVNRFYQTRRFYRQSDFYAAGPASSRFGACDKELCESWVALKAGLADQNFDLLGFDLTPAGASIQQGRVPLTVIRAVVPGLLPIWFQHGLQPAGMGPFQDATLRNETRSRARQSNFIHPFT